MVERYVALAYPKAEMVDSNSLGGLETLPRPRLAINVAEQQATIKKVQLNARPINYWTVPRSRIWSCQEMARNTLR